MFRSLLLACVLSIPACLAALDEVPLKIDPEGAHDVRIEQSGDGGWRILTTGADPYFYVRTDGAPIDLKQQPVFAFDYFSTTGVGRTLVFVGRAVDVPHMVSDELGRCEGWAGAAVDMTATQQAPEAPVTSLRVTLGQRPGIDARLRALRARPATDQEKTLAKNRERSLRDDRSHADRLRAYLGKEFPHHIDAVTADHTRITITGKLTDQADGLLLAEVPMWEDITALKNPASLRPVPADADGNFSVTVDRASATDRDMLLSAWALVRRGGDHFEILSAMRYMDDEVPRASLPPARPRSRKGIGGCAFDHPDMQALGIAAVTLNIIPNELFSADAGPGKTPYQFAGRTWQVNDDAIARLDRDMKLAAERGWMVSAIVLLPPVRQAPAGAWIREAAHPDADPGAAFVMPNFTTRAGANAWAAAMDFLTERYSRPDGGYGRVHHWIMHNEINSGFFWTSAGNKTSITYLDLYQKSMRVASLLARQYDPNAKPFISLDHCWTARPDTRCHAARDLLDHLADFSRKEGNFPWGIAFHPYPQDIANPRTWLDSQATFDFSTPFLTYKNIEVLDAWARQPRVMFRGTPREIQLTEQGLNSPDYQESTLADQAAGMAYAWKKIEPLTTITAFQYHLWADDHGEGGLRLGLRKFADDPADPHGTKPIWNLYKAIDTPDWDAASQFAKPILGIHDWSEIQHRGPIAGGGE